MFRGVAFKGSANGRLGLGQTTTITTTTSVEKDRSNGDHGIMRNSMQKREEEAREPKRLSIELPSELQERYNGSSDANGRNGGPRKRSSWFTEMCLGKEEKRMTSAGMELSAVTPSSSISGPTTTDGKPKGRGGGVGSRFRASIYSVLGKLGRCGEEVEGGREE